MKPFTSLWVSFKTAIAYIKSPLTFFKKTPSNHQGDDNVHIRTLAHAVDINVDTLTWFIESYLKTKKLNDYYNETFYLAFSSDLVSVVYDKIFSNARYITLINSRGIKLICEGYFRQISLSKKKYTWERYNARTKPFNNVTMHEIAKVDAVLMWYSGVHNEIMKSVVNNNTVEGGEDRVIIFF